MLDNALVAFSLAQVNANACRSPPKSLEIEVEPQVDIHCAWRLGTSKGFHGAQAELQSFLRFLPPQGELRQTILLSATVPDEVDALGAWGGSQAVTEKVVTCCNARGCERENHWVSKTCAEFLVR